MISNTNLVRRHSLAVLGAALVLLRPAAYAAHANASDLRGPKQFPNRF